MVKFMMQKITDVCPKAETITSRTNPLVVVFSKLSQSKYRQQQSLFLAEGKKLSREAAALSEIRYILLRSTDGTADSEMLSIASKAPSRARVIVLPPQVFEKISTENAPEGIITVLSPITRLHSVVSSPDTSAFDALKGQRIIAVDSVQDPGNLGTIIRTAAAFGYSRILLGGCADIYHPKTVRASMGALFRMSIDVCTSLVENLSALQKGGRRVLAAALSDSNLVLGKDKILSDDCVVIGNEGHGVCAEILSLADNVIRIPMRDGTESLNAAGAAAVLMWEYYRTFD